MQDTLVQWWTSLHHHTTNIDPDRFHGVISGWIVHDPESAAPYRGIVSDDSWMSFMWNYQSDLSPLQGTYELASTIDTAPPLNRLRKTADDLFGVAALLWRPALLQATNPLLYVDPEPYELKDDIKIRTKLERSSCLYSAILTLSRSS